MSAAAVGLTVASVDAIRAHFPSLTRREGAQPGAYLDGPGGTQVPRVVADAMSDYLLHHNANTHWVYPTSVETDALLAAARDVATVEVLANRYTLNDTERAGVLRHLIIEGDLSGYGLVNAVTHYSQDVEDYDRATEFEALGGKLIELAPTEWKGLAHAA